MKAKEALTLSKTSTRKHATRAASTVEVTHDKPEEQLYALDNIHSTLSKYVTDMHGLLSLHARQAIEFCDHHYELSLKTELENRELRTSIASLRASPHRELRKADDAEKLLGKQHSHAVGLLVKRDMEVRAARSENNELRELLSASQAVSQEAVSQEGHPGLVDRCGQFWSEPASPATPLSVKAKLPRRRSFTSTNSTSSCESGGRSLSSAESMLNKISAESDAENRRRCAMDRLTIANKKPFESSNSSLVQDIMLPGHVYDSSSFADDTSSSSSDDGLDHAKHVLEAGVTVKSTDMKAKMLQTIAGSKHNVADLYHEAGYAQLIAKHPVFEFFIMAVVSLNVIWIGVDASFNDQELLINADLSFILVENLFCVIFSWELAVRFVAFRSKRQAFKDAWFCFDAVILLFMVAETWAMSVIMLIADLTDVGSFSPGFLRLLRILKFFRMARLARLLRNVPEIMILLKGLVVALRSICCTVCLLATVIYVFAVAFKQLCKDTRTGETHFPDVGAAMFTLFFNGCLYQNLPQLAGAVFSESPFLGLLLLIFMLVSPLTIMNMLIGVLVQVVDTVASCEQESSIATHIEERVSKVVNQIDENSDGEISESEFLAMLRNPDLLLSLAEVGIDVLELIDAPGLVFQGKDSLQVDEFVQRMVLMRGGNAATFRDVILLRKSLLQDLSSLLTRTNHRVPEQQKKGKRHSRGPCMR